MPPPPKKQKPCLQIQGIQQQPNRGAESAHQTASPAKNINDVNKPSEQDSLMNITEKFVPKTLHRALTARVPTALDQQDRSPRSSAGILGYRLKLA